MYPCANTPPPLSSSDLFTWRALYLVEELYSGQRADARTFCSLAAQQYARARGPRRAASAVSTHNYCTIFSINSKMRNETYLAIRVLELMVDLQSRAVEVFGAHLPGGRTTVSHHSTTVSVPTGPTQPELTTTPRLHTICTSYSQKAY